jgi:hypothetical protein
MRSVRWLARIGSTVFYAAVAFVVIGFLAESAMNSVALALAVGLVGALTVAALLLMRGEQHAGT